MVATFNGETLLIVIDNMLTSFDAADLYSEWKDWIMLSDNAKYPPAFRTIGGDTIGASLSVGAYFFLQNQDGWRIRSYEADHELTIIGNLYPEDPDLAMFAPTLGNYTVAIKQNVSSLTQKITTDTAAGDIADAVWNASKNSYAQEGTMGGLQNSITFMSASIKLISDIETGTWMTEGSQIVYYMSGSNVELARFNLQDINGNSINTTNWLPYKKIRV